jgi:excisionase family DNA binding protein
VSRQQLLLPAALEELIELTAKRILELQQEQQTSTPDDTKSPWLNIASAADYLDWPRQRLYKLTAAGAIPHYKHDGRLLFHRQELDTWIRDFAQSVKRLALPPDQSYS